MDDAIKLKIEGGNKTARNFKILYKDKEISACILNMELYLCKSNAIDIIKELIENSHVESAWQKIDRKQIYKGIDYIIKQEKDKEVK